MSTLKGVLKRGNYWTWYWCHRVYTGGKQIERSNHYRTENEASTARQAYIKSQIGHTDSPVSRSYNYQNHGYIYILQYDQYYKIGQTIHEDPFRRINTIMGSMPLPPVLVCLENVKNVIQIEQALHHRYRDSHTNGEWFLLQDWEIKEIRAELAKHKYISPLATRYRYVARDSMHRYHIVQTVPGDISNTQFYCETCMVKFQGRERCIRRLTA